jgi:hypothetical protein
MGLMLPMVPQRCVTSYLMLRMPLTITRGCVIKYLIDTILIRQDTMLHSIRNVPIVRVKAKIL